MSIKLTVWVILGIIIGYYAELAPLLLLMVMVVLLPILFWASKKQSRSGFPYVESLTATITITLGAFVVGMSTNKGMPDYYGQLDVQQPMVWHLKVEETLKPNAYSHRYVAKVISADKRRASGKLLLSLTPDPLSKPLEVDDEFVVYAPLEGIRSPLNPYQFDYQSYLQKQGIHHQIRTNYPSILKTEKNSTTLFGRASRFREHIISKLKERDFGKDEMAVIQALLLGKRDDISQDTYNNYKNAGAVHILAVSGLHVGIILFLLELLLIPLERLPKGKTLKLVLVVLLLWAYAFLAGLSPSIVRAVTMFSFVAYALYLNRPTSSFNIIALSMLFILLIKPLFLFQVGFQMSYAAVFAIVWIYPKLQRFWFPENFLLRKTWQLLSVSVAAQLGVLPISLFYFHQFPALFFISNLLIIPFLGLILGVGILVIVLAQLEALPSFLVDGFNGVIHIMNAIVGWVAQQEGFIIKDIPFDSVQLLLGYAIIFALVTFLSQPIKKTALLLFAGIVLFQSWSIWSQFQMQQKETLILAHRSRNSVILHQLGDSLSILTSNPTNMGNIANDYAVAERIQTVDTAILKNSYILGEKRLVVVDSMALFPLEKQPDYLLLTESPRFHLERLLDSIQPKTVLADGSNYPSLVAKWKATCSEKEIPFHYTVEKGFYVFKF